MGSLQDDRVDTDAVPPCTEAKVEELVSTSPIINSVILDLANLGHLLGAEFDAIHGLAVRPADLERIAAFHTISMQMVERMSQDMQAHYATLIGQAAPPAA